jgi:prevent-host-death family protein
LVVWLEEKRQASPVFFCVRPAERSCAYCGDERSQCSDQSPAFEELANTSTFLAIGLNMDYIWSDAPSEVQTMKYSTQIKPISYLKANAAEIVRRLAEQREPLVITQNGEAKMVIQDVASFEETQETMALLKILALGNRQIEEGRVVPAVDVVKRLREKKASG